MWIRKFICLILVGIAGIMLSGCEAQNPNISLTIDKSGQVSAKVFVFTQDWNKISASLGGKPGCDGLNEARFARPRKLVVENASFNNQPGCLASFNLDNKEVREIIELKTKTLKYVPSNIDIDDNQSSLTLSFIKGDVRVADRSSKYTTEFKATFPTDISSTINGIKTEGNTIKLHIIDEEKVAGLSDSEFEQYHPKGSVTTLTGGDLGLLKTSSETEQKQTENIGSEVSSIPPMTNPYKVKNNTIEPISMLTWIILGVVAVAAVAFLIYASWRQKVLNDGRRSKITFEESIENMPENYTPVLSGKNNGWGFIDGDSGTPKNLLDEIEPNSFGGLW